MDHGQYNHDVMGMGADMHDDDKAKRSHMHLPPQVKKEAKRLLERGGGQVPRDEEIAMLVDSNGQSLVDGMDVTVKRVRQYCYGLTKRRRSKGITVQGPPVNDKGIPTYLADRKLDDRKPVRQPTIEEIRTVIEWEAQKLRRLHAKLQKNQAGGRGPLPMHEFLKTVTETSPPREDIHVLTKEGVRKVPSENGLLVQLFMARWGLVDDNQECNALVQRLFRQYVESGFDAGFGQSVGPSNDDDLDEKGASRNHMHLPQHIKKSAKRLLDEKGGEMPTELQIEPLVEGSRISCKRVKQYLHGLAKRKRRNNKSHGLGMGDDVQDDIMGVGGVAHH